MGTLRYEMRNDVWNVECAGKLNEWNSIDWRWKPRSQALPPPGGREMRKCWNEVAIKSVPMNPLLMRRTSDHLMQTRKSTDSHRCALTCTSSGRASYATRGPGYGATLSLPYTVFHYIYSCDANKTTQHHTWTEQGRTRDQRRQMLRSIIIAKRAVNR